MTTVDGREPRSSGELGVKIARLYKNVVQSPGCELLNRCHPSPVSWDAYVFRPPIKLPNKLLLNDNIYMNMG